MFRLPPALLSAIALTGGSLVTAPSARFIYAENWRFTPFGASRRTVAQDRRAAKKRRAVRRARKLGHA